MPHAKLSPSDSERWLDCPAAISMDKHFPDTESFEAREGSAAHELASIEARYAFKQIDELQVFDLRDAWITSNAEFDQKEISRHVDKYVEFLVSHFADSAMVFIEKQVHTEETDVWGTADFISVAEGRVDIVDLKYGQGIAVTAYDNPQIRIYGVGVLDFCVGLVMAGLIEDVPETVGLTIYQPRRTGVTSEDLRAAELQDWFAYTVMPAVKKVELPDPPFGPSARACRWCPASGQCKAQVEMQTREDFTTPGLMTPAEMGEAMERAKSISVWLEALSVVSKQKLIDGETIPGWKAVRTSGIRQIKDSAAAIQTLIDAGFKAEQVAVFKTKGIGELEKLVGIKELPSLLGDLLVKTAGAIQVARDTDKRAGINPNTEAAKDFE